MWKAWILVSAGVLVTKNFALWAYFSSNELVTAHPHHPQSFPCSSELSTHGLEAGIATGLKYQPPLVGREVAKEPSRRGLYPAPVRLNPRPFKKSAREACYRRGTPA